MIIVIMNYYGYDLLLLYIV